MAARHRHRSAALEAPDPIQRLDTFFDDMGGLLPPWLPELLRGAWSEREGELGGFLRVDELREGDELVIRAELPGIDPEHDVQIEMVDHHLHIEADRREEEETEERGFVRRELRRGHLSRDLALPEGVGESDVAATYRDGVLEIRVQLPAEVPTARIPVERG